MLYDALIIGGGPAGLSAALALGRVRRSVLLFDSGAYRNAGVTAMHTVLSRDGISPADFRDIAVRQIKHYSTIHFQHSQVVNVSQAEVVPGYTGFQVVDSSDNVFTGRKIILATGTQDVFPTNFPGYEENWPQHIYQCLFCDGFEEKDFPIGVLTFSDPSYNHLVLMALQLNPDVTIYTNGSTNKTDIVQEALKIAVASGAKIDSRLIKRLINNGPGPERGITIEFEDESSVTLGMLLHKPPTKNRDQHLIDQLRLKTREGSGEVVVDPVFGETSVPGCFAAGDTSGLIKQVAVAMGSGVRAGAVVSMQLCNEEGARAVASSSANDR